MDTENARKRDEKIDNLRNWDLGSAGKFVGIPLPPLREEFFDLSEKYLDVCPTESGAELIFLKRRVSLVSN